MGPARKLMGFLSRERRQFRELRPKLGARRAIAERTRVNLELEARLQSIDERLAEHDEALNTVAARIDAHDAVAHRVAVPAPRPRARKAPRRPFPTDDGRLRILGANEMFPLISETYVREELCSLIQFGAHIAWYRRTVTVPAPMPVTEPVFTDFEDALETVRPDLAIAHWLTSAQDLVPLFERHELPFGVRAHSFDFDQGMMTRLLDHPLCVGGWTYPAAEYESQGAHPLGPIFSPAALPRPPASARDKVVSVSAGLPKKDWPLLLEAFDLIEDADRRLIVGVTIGHEENPAELARACQGLANPPLLQVNMARDAVLALLSSTAVSVYTLQPDTRFGMPMSIVDALCSGCSVVVPDRPEARAFAGPNARTYRSAHDIAEHVREVLAGGERITAEQEENRRYGIQRFCDPETPRRFNEQLRRGLQRVRDTR